jgi:hypothetical protein
MRSELRRLTSDVRRPLPALVHEVLPLQPELKVSFHAWSSIEEADAGVALPVLPRHFSLELHR